MLVVTFFFWFSFLLCARCFLLYIGLVLFVVVHSVVVGVLSSKSLLVAKSDVNDYSGIIIARHALIWNDGALCNDLHTKTVFYTLQMGYQKEQSGHRLV